MLDKSYDSRTIPLPEDCCTTCMFVWNTGYNTLHCTRATPHHELVSDRGICNLFVHDFIKDICETCQLQEIYGITITHESHLWKSNCIGE